MTDLRIWRSVSEVPADLGRTVVTIGNFDGVHLGHQHVVRRSRETAAELDVDTVVAVTFDPHPMAVLRPDHAPPTLSGIEDRAALLHAAGVDAVLVLPFDREMASWTPEEFIQRVLVDALHARGVAVGANFRFGNRAAGDVTHPARGGGAALLRRRGHRARRRPAGLVVDVRPHLPGHRRRLRCRRGTGPAVLRPRHRRRGRQARPRARLPDRQRARRRPHRHPRRRRVRRVAAALRHRRDLPRGDLRRHQPDLRRRARSAGSRPTCWTATDLELYGVEVEVSFVEWLRGMVRFDGVDALVATMNDDVARARELLGR